jgi:hypothetical protein
MSGSFADLERHRFLSSRLVEELSRRRLRVEGGWGHCSTQFGTEATSLALLSLCSSPAGSLAMKKNLRRCLRNGGRMEPGRPRAMGPARVSGRLRWRPTHGCMCKRSPAAPPYDAPQLRAPFPRSPGSPGADSCGSTGLRVGPGLHALTAFLRGRPEVGPSSCRSAALQRLRFVHAPSAHGARGMRGRCCRWRRTLIP